MRDRSTIKYSQIEAVLKEENLFVSSFKTDDNADYTKIETNSRLIKQNDVFVCIKGFVSDGHDFAKKAKENGAVLFIVEEKLGQDYPQIIAKDSRKAAAILGKLFFSDPTSRFKLIGITGTNGKTTIANLTEEILRKNGKKTGLIGTLGYSILGVDYKSERTTPDIFDLNRIFGKMVKADVEYVIMEVSSHALALERVFGLHFDLAFFTNLTQDHLDFHSDMDDYAATKFKLFSNLNNGIALLNFDDTFGKQFYNKIDSKKFSISFDTADFEIKNCEFGIESSSFELNKMQIRTQLIGKFNIFNVAAAAAIVQLVSPEITSVNLADTIADISHVRGRLESVSNDRNIGIYVDYAHTPDALENVLSTLAQLKKGRLICVFGAGGDRDKSKRPLMLNAALRYADLSIITNDNPRSEYPAEIILDIVGETNPEANFWIIRDRESAIKTAIRAAKENDIVLLAGKGHEAYQEINDVRTHFDDLEIAIEALHLKEDKDSLSFPIDTLMLKILFNQTDKSVDYENMLVHVSTDSRSVLPNSLFFALLGDNFDGHNYVPAVLKIENCWTIINEDFSTNHKNVIRVQDTLIAYGLLAKKYKALFGIKTIAITGSSGKTTTKEYLANILSQKYDILKTAANENNLIGLPRTIFKLRPQHNIAILELGTNQFGEIKKLTEISQPDLGIITSIGPSHLEFLIDEAGVFKEKIALFDQPNVNKFYPADDPRFQDIKGISFGKTDSCNYRLHDIKIKRGKTDFFINEQHYSIPTPFETFSLNALNAVAICSELNIEPDIIQSGLNKPLQISHRMEIQPSKNRILLIDCYNANPDSMKAALEFWLKFEPTRPHIAILGDMLELGKLTEKYHDNILRLIIEKEIDQLISVGKLSRIYKADNHFATIEQLIDSNIYEKFADDAVILIKASHGIQLEKIIGRL
jgi:MurE/MurF fusion protein